MRTSTHRCRTAAVALLVAVVAPLTACGDDSSSDATPAPGREAAAAALEQGATVIDVRTPEEYAAGHIEGARLLDVRSADFASGVAKLDPGTTYVVYCRTGHRSAAAAAKMRAAGLTVLDGGAMSDMVAAGWTAT